MKRTRISILAIFLITAAIVYGSKRTDPNLKTNAQQWMREQPVRFLENKGQMADINGQPVPYVLFTASVPGMNMYVTEKGLTYLFMKIEHEEHEKEKGDEQKKENTKAEWNRIDMALKGASIKKENIIKEGASTAFSQYFYAHCPDGISDVHTYDKITIKEIYPGIDWVLYNSDTKGFKYDFIVHPGADSKQIALVYSSLKPLKLNNDGSIIIKNKLGTLTENAPYSYIKETREEVASHFEIMDQRHIDNNYYQTTISFLLDSSFVNPNSTLVIDPQLFWATLYGGNGDFGQAGYEGSMSITTDNAGNLFIVGYTASAVIRIPLLNAGTFFQGTSGGGALGTSDAFILKFSNTGVLLWATYYGGNGSDAANSIAADNIGNIFITGFTQSGNFPVCNICPGYFDATLGGTQDAFILKFNNAGTRLWATYYGTALSGSNEQGYSVATDGAGNVFVSVFYNNLLSVEKFSNTGVLLWTHKTGDVIPRAIATDATGNVFITGSIFFMFSPPVFPDLCSTCPGYFQASFGGGLSDAAIIKLDGAGTVLWATYYGGSGDDSGRSIAVDNNGNVFILGLTKSGNFPTPGSVAGAYFDGALSGTSDAFILKFDNVGNRLWATYYGGSGAEEPPGILPAITFDNLAIDACGNIYASFETTSTNINTKPACDGGYYDNTYNGSTSDIFIANFSNTGALLWATYLGGNGSDFRAPLAVDNSGRLFISGESVATANTFPFTNPAGGAYYDNNQNQQMEDLYIAKFNKLPLAITPNSVNSGCGCTGSASVTITVGCAPFSYMWSNGSSTLNTTNNSNTITGLCPGTYTVTATSNCNQTQTATFVITGASCNTCTLTGQFTKGTANCTGCGCKEWIMVTATGGTGPYSYSWPDGYDKRYRNGLCPGAYNVKVTDKNGCSVNINLSAP
ncbi:MAG: SBBP repeat-containing protein [Bacteroidetes bacterium]|nr:SBBP repeat-containing protein [Bacteroidota bacterium]